MLQNIHLMPSWCVNTSETPVGGKVRHGDMGTAMWNNFHSFQAVLEKRLDAYAVESSTQRNIFEWPRKNMKKHET